MERLNYGSIMFKLPWLCYLSNYPVDLRKIESKQPKFWITRKLTTTDQKADCYACNVQNMIDLIETLPHYCKQIGKLKSLELEPVDVIKQARTSKWGR